MEEISASEVKDAVENVIGEEAAEEKRRRTLRRMWQNPFWRPWKIR